MARGAWIAAAVIAGTASCGGTSTGSIGAVLGRDNETHAVYVRDVPPGLAADQAGLLPGDEIMMIDGVYARDLAPSDLRAKLRGEVGSPVELTVARGNDVLRVRVIRTELRVHEEVKPKEERVTP